MSADLLRRAATRLRESALAAPRGPWSVVYFGDRGYPQRVHSERAVLVCQTYEGRDDREPVRAPAATPDFIALVHPPVALALAELLERISVMPFISVAPSVREYAESVAREVLREPEGGPVTGCPYCMDDGGKACRIHPRGREPEGGDRT